MQTEKDNLLALKEKYMRGTMNKKRKESKQEIKNFLREKQH